MTVTATQARKRWFELLKRAEYGEEVIIYHTEKKKKFLLTAQLTKPDKMELVKRMGAIGLKSASPDEIKNFICPE